MCVGRGRGKQSTDGGVLAKTRTYRKDGAIRTSRRSCIGGDKSSPVLVALKGVKFRPTTRETSATDD